MNTRSVLSMAVRVALAGGFAAIPFASLGQIDAGKSPPHAIGAVASLWMIERVVAFWA